MKKVFTFLAICFLPLIGFSAGETKYVVDDISLIVRKTESSVVRANETEVNLTETSAVMKKLHAVTLLDSSDYDYYSDWVVFYGQDESVSAIDLRIYDASGNEIEKIKSKEIEDLAAGSSNLYTDTRLKYVEVKEYDYPFTIEFSFTKRVRDTYLFLPRWELTEMPSSYVEHTSLTIKKPESIDFSYDYRLYGFELDDKVISPEKLYFSASNIDSFGPEDFGPSHRDQKPHIILSPHQFEIDGYEGSFDSWNALGAFYYQINADRYNVEDEFVAPIKSKVESASSLIDKVDVIYKHLQEKTRYVFVKLGIGGWQSFPAEYVETNSYGDCKALTTYTKSLLSYFDIESYPVLIRSGRDNDLSFQLKDDEIAYSAFNHVILAVPNEKDTIWLECTSQNQPTNYLGSFTMDRKGVMVKPNNESQLVETPQSSVERDFSKKVFDVKLDQNGGAKVNVSLDAEGLLAERYFDSMTSLSEEEIKKYLSDMIDLPNSTLIDYDFEKEEEKMVISLQANFTVKNVMKKTGSRMFLSPLQFQRKRKVIEDVENRKHPVILPFSFQDSVEVNYLLPESFQIENINTDLVEVDSQMGKYFVTSVIEDEKLTVKSVYQRFKGVYPPESAEEFEEFTTAVNKSAKQMVVLKKGMTQRSN